MALHPELQQEIGILRLFDPLTTQSGIKVRHDAALEAIAATERLFRKGLVTQPDGGYLTPLGFEAAELLDRMLTILTSAEFSSSEAPSS